MHSIIDCVKKGAAEVRKDWFKMKDKTRDSRIFAAYSCCYDLSCSISNMF
jgi:hypothetical protein